MSATSGGVEPTTHSLVKVLQPFVVGGISGCIATTCIQPLDMIKVRIQVAGAQTLKTDSAPSRNPFTITRILIKDEGFFALYRGLSAGLLRQATYSTARLGLFRVFSDYLANRNGQTQAVPLHLKAAASLLAGGLGSLIGTPADLALIRLQSDATLPPAQRRNYTGTMSALTRIIKEEGVLSLWRGATPTIVRAMLLNLGMLASFDQAKESLEPMLGTGWTCRLTASAIAGFFAATFSLPGDMIKTRIQRMKADPVTGQMPYRNFMDCAFKIAKNEGLLRFYAGYPVYYFRIAPHAMITLICVDTINAFIKNRSK